MAFLGFGRNKDRQQQELVGQAGQQGRTIIGGLFGTDAYSQAWRSQRKEAIEKYRQQKRNLYQDWRRQEKKMRERQLLKQEKKVLRYWDVPERPTGPKSDMTWPQRHAEEKIEKIEHHTWRDFDRSKREQLRQLRHQRDEQIKQMSVRLREQTNWKNNQASFSSVTPDRPVTPPR